MGENKRETLPKLLCALLFNITFQVIFSAARQLQNDTKMQNQAPSTSGSSIVFRVEGDVSHKGYGLFSFFWHFMEAQALQLMEAPHSPYQPNNNFITCSDPTCALMNQQKTTQATFKINYAITTSSTQTMLHHYTIMCRCGYHQEFLGTHTPPKVDGVLGLGNGKASIVSQLSDQGVIPKVTGHCLGGQGGGYLFLGNAPVSSPGLLRAQMSSQSVKLHDNMLAPADLLYGEQPLDYGLYVAFDSGSTYTYFEFQAYQATLHQGNVCLAILNGYDVGLPNLNIIGDNFMLDKLVIYDYENQQIGWSPSDCKWKSNSMRIFLHAYYLFHVIMLSGLMVPMFLN
ncbi:hypothetical protein RJ639_008157 [Escallonia herrerae]|uniref:Xylanase inhibitor N-terminal domain-containing protein n=1 Tax=Escallonia herrerae TaxID=1293975 RepID=A0AA89AVM1_9ASTE|nr:hypothetical protein RJ639_008157 [Escallonia herrerae]